MGFNVWAAVVAGLLGFGVGGLWYSPLLFAKPWAKMMSFDPKAPGGYPIPVAMGGAALLSVIAALVFAMFLGPNPSLGFAIGAGLACSIGWIGTSIFTNGLFQRLPLELMLINTGNHVVQFLVFALVLGLWH
jgi:hypothetical protein